MTTPQPSFAARATALGLAAFFTLAMAAGLDFLARVEPAPGTIAAAAQPRA
jgi:hypothetical protein